MALLVFQNVTFTYPERPEPALDDVSFSLDTGDFCCIMGRSGSGKTTLLRQMRTVLAPHGTRSGRVLLRGRNLADVPLREQSRSVGFVGQDPDLQLVADTVWRELAFGLENVGTPPEVMAVRVAETASYFGLQDLFDWPVNELSGGQKQLVNLASAMALRPDVLVLDEPTSQLDPVAAADFLETLRLANQDLGVTIVLTEHRLESALPLATTVLVMDGGRLACAGAPRRIACELQRRDEPMTCALPSATRIALALGAGAREAAVCGEDARGALLPLTVREGGRWLGDYLGDPPRRENVEPGGDASADNRPKLIAATGETAEDAPLRHAPAVSDADGSDAPRVLGGSTGSPSETALELRDIWFRYGRDFPDVLKGLDLSVGEGELFAVVGANGCGKSTLLSVACGLRKPYQGRVRFGAGRPVLVPQDPCSLFSRETVREELAAMAADAAEPPGRPVQPRGRRGASQTAALAAMAADAAESDALVNEVAVRCGLTDVLDRHPNDLSGGEQQRLALAMALATRPRVLLLDEPTKGVDPLFKQQLGALLRSLAADGTAVVLVSHDIEFCAQWATRAALLFDGTVTAEGVPSRLFSQAAFYTTAASRISRPFFPNVVTVDEVVRACRER